MNLWKYYTYAGRYQEDACRVLECIHSVYRHDQVTFNQLDRVLIETGLNPDSLYHQLSAGYETPQLNRLALALDLPEKSLCSAPSPLQSCAQAMIQLTNQAGSSSAEIAEIAQGIHCLAGQLPDLPAKPPKQKMPYYQKDKARRWKGRPV